MAQNGAVFVFCSSCKILYFASSVHPRIATEPNWMAMGNNHMVSGSVFFVSSYILRLRQEGR